MGKEQQAKDMVGNCTADKWVSSCGGGVGCSKLNASPFTIYLGNGVGSRYEIKGADTHRTEITSDARMFWL